MYEYEEIGRIFKINGHSYHFVSESTKKIKYYRCNKRTCLEKCRGSITISPNDQIIKRIEHTCNPLKNRNRPRDRNRIRNIINVSNT
jgi:hypothetical protein